MNSADFLGVDLPHGHSDHMPRNKGFRFEGLRKLLLAVVYYS